MSEEIVGGVSPLKKRGGKAAKRVTRKATGKGVVSGYKGRGGYKKSGGGKNKGGYNVHTRFKPRAAQSGPKGGTGDNGKDKTSDKPYSYDENGGIVINLGDNVNTNTNNNNSSATGGAGGAGGSSSSSSSSSSVSTGKTVNEDEEKNADNIYSYLETTGGTEKTTTKDIDENETSYASHWNRDAKSSYTEKYGHMTKGQRYMKHGHTPKMSEGHLENGKLKGGSYHKNGKAFHTSLEGYEEYMEYAKKESSESKESGNVKSSSSNRKGTITTTEKVGSKTYKVTMKNGKEISRVLQ